jgi:hypothetical protein
MEYFTFTQIKFLNFFLEGAFRHDRLTGPLAFIEWRAESYPSLVRYLAEELYT